MKNLWVDWKEAIQVAAWHRYPSPSSPSSARQSDIPVGVYCDGPRLTLWRMALYSSVLLSFSTLLPVLAFTLVAALSFPLPLPRDELELDVI
ncbi:MAG: hypothetical protein EOO61_14255 [Hymenobacter sp.]|nr:MAG: hypothetical protein EOO61_14255 [Hymenobacter sp.]